MIFRLLVVACLAAGALFGDSMDYTLTQTTLDDGDKGNTCMPSCQTFEFIFPAWSPYGLDNPTLPAPGTPIEQLDDIHWTFTDGNSLDQIGERADFTGSYNAPDLAPYLGEGYFAIDVTPTDPGLPDTLGTLEITFDQNEVPFQAPYDGPLYPAGLDVGAGPVATPEPALPFAALLPFAGVAILTKRRRLNCTR
jgi:hypothetical protein